LKIPLFVEIEIKLYEDIGEYIVRHRTSLSHINVQ